MKPFALNECYCTHRKLYRRQSYGFGICSDPVLKLFLGQTAFREP